jgi:hypothetical protein
MPYGEAFIAILDRSMPFWKRVRAKLSGFPLDS